MGEVRVGDRLHEHGAQADGFGFRGVDPVAEPAAKDDGDARSDVSPKSVFRKSP